MSLMPLSGVKVLDFSAYPPGGYCTVLLADLGAEIIRVEPPALKGKPSLVIGQYALSRAKRSMTLDTRNPRAPAVLARLAAGVDVVVENAAPGSMEKRGFGYSHARAANPGLIWCAITGFGQSGPMAQAPGHDLSYTAHSGLLGSVTPQLPWHPAMQLAIPVGALMAVIGIQSALLQRGRTGEGAFIDISMSESAGWVLTGGINPLSDNPYGIPATPDRRLYACADGRYVAVASAEPRTWEILCEAVGAPQLKETLRDRARAAEATETLSKIFLAKPAAQWADELTRLGAAVSLVNHGSQLLQDPQVQARGSVVGREGAYTPANPVRLRAADGAETTTLTDAPHNVGDDTQDVLTKAGFSRAELDDLAADGVI